MKTLVKMFVLAMVIAIGTNNVAIANEEQSENRKVGNFDAIKVSTGIDLYLTMGESQKVKIVADEDIIDQVITEVKGGTLHIYVKSSKLFNWGFGRTTRKAYVTVSELKGISASSGSDVKSENTLRGDELKIKASSGSDVELDVVYKDLWVDTSSGSDTRLSGRVKNLHAESSSGSEINAEDLESEICHVRTSSGSDAKVHVTDELHAKASSGSDMNPYTAFQKSAIQAQLYII